MENFVYYFFILTGLGLFFAFVRGSVIDLKTQYVPNNVVFATYFFSILFIVVSSIYLKSFTPLTSALSGLTVSFIIPYSFTNGIYYYRYFKLKRKLKKKDIELTLEKEETLKENPIIDKKFYVTIYAIAFALIIIISLISKKYHIIGIGFAALIFELLLGKLLKRFYVIEYNHAEDQFDKNENKTEDDTKIDIEENLEIGIGDGDIILFGAMGLMFSIVGFLISFVYAVFAHMLIITIFSIIKRINPFKYNIPFVPALSVGILIFVTGFDQYLFNFLNMINSILN